MQYYEIAPSVIVRAGTDTLTYAHTGPLPVGALVTIPVGKKHHRGVVCRQVPKPDYDVRLISSLLELPPLPTQLVDTALWISQYYATPLATVLQTVLPAGIAKNRRPKAPEKAAETTPRTKNVFTADQAAALEKIAAMSPGTALLHGITGSGKTLVYIEAARAAVESGKSVVVLVPEIALTSQLVKNFSQHFGSVIVTHSRQTEAARFASWKQALTATSPTVVIGPRSALFMPLSHIGLIVVDECHEPSFKQEQSPRYSALRVASVLASHHQAKTILGSATPSITDYYQAAHAKRPIIEMPSLARTDAVRPSVKIIDMTSRANFTEHRLFSDALLACLRANFAAGEQALIFHNRRGTASTTLCENCGWQAGCPHCFIPLTLHADRHTLLCHICGASSKVPTSCPECHYADIIHKGIGTKLIESELRRLFPDQTIARFDGDTDNKQTVEQRYHELHDGSIGCIIGTQVVAKGLDLPHLRTVGVVQADAGLSLPDFSAPERTFQLLAQVIGRVGRSHHPTTVIVQSYQPNHPAIQDGLSQNYADFYERTLALRKHTSFPPFTHLLKLTCSYKTEATAYRNASKLADTLRSSLTDIEILGPTPAFYERVRDTYRWQLVIKSKSRSNLLGVIPLLPSTHWHYELDPVSLL
jgi:primosomal protein N' (replication factor Y)